jgi:peptidoglycan L-alanyl-D-glutamate endopeptidase CwlK
MKKPIYLLFFLPVLILFGVLIYLATRKKGTGVSIPKSTAKPNQEIWDSASANKISELHPKIRNDAERFIIAAQNRGIKLRVTSGFRSFAEQQKLYNQTPKVTNAEPGESYHNYGLAFDVVEISNGQALWNNSRWSEIGNLGKQFGFGWGGDWTSFVDKPHFQNKFGYHWSQLKPLQIANPNQYVPI